MRFQTLNKFFPGLIIGMILGLITPSLIQDIEKSAKEIVVEQMIQCESRGRNIKIVDTNGYWSYGKLMFQKSTWGWFSEMSRIKGNPMKEEDAIKMFNWVIDNRPQYISQHWKVCYKKIKNYAINPSTNIRTFIEDKTKSAKLADVILVNK